MCTSVCLSTACALVVCASAHLYRLWVIEMVTQVHQDLRHPVRDVIGARQDARTEAEHSGMAPHQV